VGQKPNSKDETLVVPNDLDIGLASELCLFVATLCTHDCKLIAYLWQLHVLDICKLRLLVPARCTHDLFFIIHLYTSFFISCTNEVGM
jgi:hypothetical protein